MGGSIPAISPVWTPTATSASPDASKTSSFAEAEDLPVVEIENLLYRHPAIRQVAIVGVPDPRLGERACAFVVLREGEHLDFAEMVAYLERQQLARQYFPEYVKVLPQMPMTVSGKIQKFQLREMAKSLGEKQ